MKLIKKIAFLLFIIICTSDCYNNSAVKITKFDGQDFVSCNIDKIKDTFNLKLSDIAEYSEIVVLSNDSTLKVEDYQIERIVASDKYIVVMPRSTPALLYTRKGKFIKKLTPFGSSKSEKLYGIHAQIDDERDMVYLLVCGLKLLRFNVYDFNVVNIPKAVEKSMDFVLFNNDKMFVTYHNDQNIWGYIQSIHSPQAEYLCSRSANNLFNYMSSRWGEILKWRDSFVLNFISVNDTSYYYNKRNKTFKPFLCCFSPKNSVEFREQIENSPELLELAASEILNNNKLLKKRLLFINERYCLFRLFDGTRKYYVIDKHNQQAYFLDKIINDFCGGLDMDYVKLFEGWRYVNNKDGYLTFNYSIDQLKKELKKLKIDSSNETFKNKLIRLINENDSRNILFINKLKN